MSKKIEKIEELTQKLNKLDESQKPYIIGMIEGMAAANDINKKVSESEPTKKGA